MGFLKKISDRLILPVIKRALTEEPIEEYIARMKVGIDTADFGVTVNNATALRFSATYACIRVRSENMASLPKNIKEKTSKGWEIAEHPISNLINSKPNDYTNVFDFWQMMFANLDGWGNGYAIIERSGSGDPIALHQVHSSNVDVRVINSKKWFRVTGATGRNGVYPNEDMLHFMGLSFDGVEGVNPIEYNASSFAKALAARKFGAEFYKKGGNIKGVLETDSSMNDTQFDQFTKHFQESSQNYDTPLLEYGIKYKSIGINPVSAQLLATEEFSITDIARIFNVPPHMIGDLTRSTFSNIEQQTIQFAQFALRPTLKKIETELEDKLFFTSDRLKFSVKFDINGLMRGDMAARGTWYAQMIQNGVYNRNEVRAIEGLTHKEGLDEFLYPSNMLVVGENNTTENEK